MSLPDTAKAVPLVLDEGQRNGELVFTVNNAVFPDVPVVMVELGGVRILEVKQESEMDHPFHLHGFFFQVLDRNGTRPPLESSGNKDTILVPGKSSMKLVSRFNDDLLASGAKGPGLVACDASAAYWAGSGQITRTSLRK